MNALTTLRPDYAPPNRVRRTLIGGMAVGYALLWVPHGFAAAASASASALADDGLPHFLRVSSFLTGRADLDSQHAARLLTAMQANDATFAARLRDLASFIASRQPDPLQLQAMLDTQKAPFAGLPRQIATAWYIGVVGSGTSARCLTYVSSLMNVAVSDHLRPSSYAYGAYGTWTAKPV